MGKTDLIVWESAVLVDGVDSCDARADRFAFQHRFLFAFGEQRNVVVDILQDDVDGRFAGQLLNSVILHTEIDRSQIESFPWTAIHWLIG